MNGIGISLFLSICSLHSCIQKNLPYPETFKYGPDRPPPIVNLRQPVFTPDGLVSQSYEDPSRNNTGSAAPSELDQLFAKFNMAGASSTPSNEPHVTIDSLFAGLSGSQAPNPPAVTTTVAPPAAPSTGLALLDSIFASAAPAQPAQIQPLPNGTTHLTIPSLNRPLSSSSLQGHAPAEPESIIIYSPTPTTTALPQILNQDVISTLLGLPGSRASSAAPTTASQSTTSTSREGGDEDDGGSTPGSSNGRNSHSNTVLGTVASEVPVSSNGKDVHMTASKLFASLLGNAPGDEDIVLGDVTPRVTGGVNGHGPDTRRQAAPALQASSSTATLRAFVESQPVTAAQPKPERNIAPFRADSDLWPHPRAPLDDRDGQEDIVELDFTDTSALSDPAAFDRKASQGRRLAQNNRGGATQGIEVSGGSECAGEPSIAASEDGHDGSHKKTRRRPCKRERLAAAQLEQVDQSWDAPEIVQRQPHLHAINLGASSPSPIPALPPSVAPDSSKMVNILNGNGKVPGLDRTAVQAGLARLASTKIGAGKAQSAKLDRKDFVMEVLTLIHRDKEFVDALYQDYVTRLD
ncbi:hypothetical protein HGRIS_000390 [Hohenbuehelia grisea]|uniref:mRNA-decapping enzyme C-terminal domain-containing protein n=1 Tax=Hohenbuehelia grisea TaxID=104357 RepID=A0ABR3JQX0_9AGAR